MLFLTPSQMVTKKNMLSFMNFEAVKFEISFAKSMSYNFVLSKPINLNLVFLKSGDVNLH